MPYLQPSLTADTQFPRGNGADLAQDIALIEEAWETHYPLVTYYPLDKRTTPVADANTLSGEAGASKFDPLYGESIDPAQTVWKQPHGTGGTVKAAVVEVWGDPVSLRAQVSRITDDTDMKKLGFDANDKWIGGLVLAIPASLLDKVGVTCQAGDKVVWDGDEFMVKRPLQSGYWHNTNVRLYLKLTCERHLKGS